MQSSPSARYNSSSGAGPDFRDDRSGKHTHRRRLSTFGHVGIDRVTENDDYGHQLCCSATYTLSDDHYT